MSKAFARISADPTPGSSHDAVRPSSYNRGMLEYLDADSQAVLHAWLQGQPAITRPQREVSTSDAFTCTTSTGSVTAALWAGDVPMTLDAAVSNGIADEIKPLPRSVVVYTLRSRH
jgi:hypothetical protein